MTRDYAFQRKERAKALANSALLMLASGVNDYTLAGSLLRRASDECKVAERIEKDDERKKRKESHAQD